MNSSRRTPIVLGTLIVLLLAVGGFVLLRDSSGDGNRTDLANGGTETPSEVASEATNGGLSGGDPQPSESPSEVASEVTSGGIDAGGLPTEDTEPDGGDGAESEDPTIGEASEPAGGDGTDGDSGDGGTDDGAGGGDGGTGGDTDDRDLAGDLEADTQDASEDGDLPETGATALLPGLMLLGAGLALRPRR